MKKLWYLFLSLFLAFGVVACEDKGDIVPDPEPGPVGPTAAPISVVTDIAFERDGYQAVELSWVAPEEEYPITNYSIIVKCEGQDDLKFDFTADELEEADGKQIAVIEGLEQPLYSATILAGNSYGLQKNGAQIGGIAPFTLETMVMPTFAIVDEEGSKYLRLNNVNGSRNIFDHIEVSMKDSSGNVVFEGEAAASDDDLVAALDDKQANTDPVDILIALEEGLSLDESETYAVDYTIYAHPAIGGVAEEGVITYEDVLDMGAEPASIEGSAENLGVGVEVQPLYFHFYSHGSKYLTELEQAVITVPQEYVAVSEGSTQKEPKYASYKIYTGTSESNYELYTEDVDNGVYPSDGEPWYTADQIDPYSISELVPNSNKEMNLYAAVWAGQAINTISLKHEVYPSYVRVEAFDKYGRMVAMGQRLCPTFSVGASQPDIQAHQPKWELLPGGDGLTYKLKASHLSAARAYARTVKWSIKDEEGNVVAEDKVEGGSASGKAPTYATLITNEWVVEAKNFDVNKKYSVDYEIDYIPVYVIPGMDDQQPLDYDPETGRFTPTEGGVVANATGLDHDVRILRDYIRDENSNVKYRLREKDAEGNNVYEFKHESGDYRGWVAWMDKSVILTSEELIEAGAVLENELTIPEDNGEPAEYKINLKASVPKKMNTVNLSWDAFAAEEITKVVINDGGKDIVVTEGGQYAWTVSDGRASFELEGITGGPEVFIKVSVYAGETILGEDEIGANIFTLNNWEAPQFEWVRLQDGRYKFVVKNMANINYAFSFNIYEDVANSPKTNSTIRFYDNKNQLVQTLTATPAVVDWWSYDWSCYARWQLSFQDTWDEWVWEGNYDSKGAAQREVPATALATGNYRIEYEFGYVVNKNGFWSTTDASNPTRVESRPDITVYPQACVAFPPQVAPPFNDSARNENVLYCENRCQMDLPDDGNLGKRHMVKVFVKEGEDQFSVNMSTAPEVLAFADIDEGTTRIDTQYDDYVGLMSNNGLFESAKVSWEVLNAQYDKIVIAYGDKTVEVTDGSTSKVIEGLKTSPVEFTVTAYKGSEAIASGKVSTDVYVLPDVESLVEFDVTYDKDKFGWYINMPKGLSTQYYGTWIAKFNVYKKGESTPVFASDVTKNGNEEIITFKKWMARGYIDYHMTNNDWEAPAANWDAANKLFKGLEFATDYEIRYELSVYPMIYNAENAGNTETKFYHKKMLMNSDAANGTQTLTGTFEFTTPEGPAELAPFATVSKTQYQAATVSWNKIEDASGYEVYVGSDLVATANADATSVEVTELNDDSIYEFTVKAVGTSVEGKTAKTGIFTLAKWVEPTFEFNGKRMVVSGLTSFDQPGGAGYAYGGTTAEGGKSTIEIYKEDGTLLYTLTNSTPQGTLNSWANSGCMVLSRVENRQDWSWAKADGSPLMAGEVDVPEGSLPAGTYTLKWTIGYTLYKNCNWSTGQSDANIVANKADATQLWFGPKDDSSRPNVWHNGTDVGLKTKTGETTLVVK